MKLPKLTLLLAAFLALSYPLRATQWEFAMRVLTADGLHCASMQVYLYNANDLSVPIRTGWSTSGIYPDNNFFCDIWDQPYYLGPEPDMSNPSWRMIKSGLYVLRVEGYYTQIVIAVYTPQNGIGRDFELQYRPGYGFSVYSGNRCSVGDTYAWTGSTNCQMSMDQKLSNGSTTIGDIFHVFPDGMDIWTSATAQTISIHSPSTQTLRADTLVYSGQKYHDWIGSSDVSNHHSFSVTGNSISTIVRFLERDNSINVTTDLLDAPGNPVGNVEFADPWFRDYQDASYGGRLRNQGTSAQFHQRQAPFNPNESSSYEHGAYYNGVFLNQGSSQDWIEPYYSIGALSPISFSNGPAVFAYWSGSNVQLQSPSSARTGVIFTAAGAQAKAWYKYHLGSTVSSPTSYNSQRKVAKVGSRYHMVYSSGGRIWYATSTNNCTTWSVEQEASRTVSGFQAINPSFFVDGFNTVYLAYEEVYGSTHLLDIRSKTLTGSWQDDSMNLGFDGSLELKPVIEGLNARYTVVVQASGLNGNNDPGLYYLSSLRGTVAKVPETSSTSVSPSLTWMNLAYQDGNAIYQKHYTYGVNDIVFEARQLVSSNYVNGRLVTNISNPSIDTRVETGGERRTATAWQAQDLVFSAYRPVFVRHSTGGTDVSPTFVTTVFDWGDPNAKGRTPSVTSCYSGTYTNPDVAAVWQHDPSDPNGTYPYVVAVNKVNGTWTGQSTLSTNGRYCTSVVGNANQSNGGALTAWSSSSGPVYSVTANQGTNGTLSKTHTPRFARGMDIDLAGLGVDGLSGTLSMYVEESGSLKFQSLTDSISSLRDFLSGEILGSQAVNVPYRLSLFDVQLPASKAALPADLVALTVETTGSDGSNRPTGTIALGTLLALWADSEKVDKANEIAETVGSFNGLHSGTFRIVANSSPGGGGGEPRLYEFVLSSDSSGLQKQRSQVQLVPQGFGLDAAYPNPFNPTTTIAFALPMDAKVHLVVYDLLGREIACLANGLHQAGYHTITWNARNAATGSYVARLVVFDALGKEVYTKTSKLVLMK